MSQGEKSIICRRCKETYPIDAETCPHCGTGIRSRTIPIAAIVIGGLLAGVSLFEIDQLFVFGIFGAILLVIGAYLLQDQRRRINEANRGAEGE